MINRRSFVKGLLGIAALPSVAIGKILKSDTKKSPSYCVIMDYQFNFRNSFQVVRYVGTMKLRKGDPVFYVDDNYTTVDCLPMGLAPVKAVFKIMLPADMEKPLFEGSDTLFYRRRPVSLDRVKTTG